MTNGSRVLHVLTDFECIQEVAGSNLSSENSILPEISKIVLRNNRNFAPQLSRFITQSHHSLVHIHKQKTIYVALSPLANYTD
jgi:hypothetical protein